MNRFTLPVAVHLLLLRGDEVLLLRRFNTGYEDGNYSVPAGHLDGGETMCAAAVREALEEVGVVLAPQDVRVVGIMHRRAAEERIDFFVSAARWAGAPVNCEPCKCDELRELRSCALDALPANVIPYVRCVLDNFRRGVWFATFGW